jgi:hypothetical protein
MFGASSRKVLRTKRKATVLEAASDTTLVSLVIQEDILAQKNRIPRQTPQTTRPVAIRIIARVRRPIRESLFAREATKEQPP